MKREFGYDYIEEFELRREENNFYRKQKELQKRQSIWSYNRKDDNNE